MTNKNSLSGKSIFRVVKILTSIGEGATSITDIAKMCNLSKATVHRILKVLEESHLVHHDLINRQYLLGTLFINFVSKPQVTHAYLTKCAFGEMKRLSDLTQDTIHLDILSGLNIIVLSAIPSKHPLRIVEEICVTEHLHAGATAKVLLSQLNNADLKVVFKHMNFVPFTENTVVHADELLVQVKRIKKQGYAVSFSERIPGGVSISTAITDYIVPAALTVLGPQERIKPRISEILDEMKKSSAIISKRIQEALEIKNEKMI